ncbi:MAG: SLBB domain-containing protein [Chloroflexi bacterium]|nr:SLBB domain-containing protein [Chloroflexota bacterium]
MTESPKLPLLERFKYPVLLLITLAIAVGIVVLLSERPKPTTITVFPPEPTLIPSATLVPSVTPTPGPFMVYITGAVEKPEQVVTLGYGSRVLHALDAAGGALENADLERVNLAQILEDGDQIHVPTRKAGEPNETPPTIPAITPTPGSYTVYVTGEVKQPQAMITLPRGSRVEDAIRAAGGITDNANVGAVNLAQILNDGDLVYIPPLSGEPLSTPTPNHPPLVHINSATVEDLDTLPGVGPALAQAILDYRVENGPFASLEDLDNVPGFGPSKLEAIRDLVVFD